MNCTINFQPIGRRLQVEKGRTTILQALQKIGFFEEAGIVAPCGGKGVCGHCRVKIVEGDISLPTENEKNLLSKEELDTGYRLACQAVVIDSVKVEIPPESLIGRQELQIEGQSEFFQPEPAVKRYMLELEETSIENPVSVWQQVERVMYEHYKFNEMRIDLDLLRKAPALSNDKHVTFTMRGHEVINAYFTKPVPRPLGLAVDLGTTKIAGYLIDLENGNTLASEGIMNPQISCGEDVISRLAYALEGNKNYLQITQAAVYGLNRLLQILQEKAGVKTEDVEDAVIVGNTAMHHLLLSLPISQLAEAPYVPAAVAPMEIKARDLGLNIAPGALVYLMPPIAGFVGGDHVGMILGSRIDKTEEVTLGLDIGTNTEVVLARNGEMISCSCASGPAFEGAQIKYGMRAVAGAVKWVKLTDGGRRVLYKTIGEQPPLGICGSGILDAVAELYRHNVINENGMLNRNHPRVRTGEKNIYEFLLAPAEECSARNDLVITQKDISAIQLAKAAIASGTKLLLKEFNLRANDLKKVVVAGAFGTYLQLESAIAIGMLPNIPITRYRQVGNAAGAGARLALVSMAERKRAEKIARSVKYLELATQEFGSTFMEEIRFPGGFH